MRIIAGEFKGRRIEPPEGRHTRPTSDKVREAIFSILMEEIYGSVFCDVFAGSGAMGLEALSRGAKKAYFFESSAGVMTYLKNNINKCKMGDKAIVYRGDYKKGLSRLAYEKEKVDIFFIDPPFGENLIQPAMSKIEEMDILAEDGLILAEHDVRDPLPEKIGSFRMIKQRKYGKVVISIFMC